MPKQITYCSIDECDRPCVGHGYCRKHYNRWYRYGDPTITKKTYRQEATCSVDNCANPSWAKGFCQNHYALMRRNGEPVRTKIFVGIYIKDGYRYVHVGYRHYEPEHRVVMERFLGRKLTPEEHIHHIDGDTLNNSPSNLQIVSRSEHLKIHIQDRPRKGGRWAKKE